MTYIKTVWRHALPDEPTVLYSEIDSDRREVRKVEIFADGRVGRASTTFETPSTGTGHAAIPYPELSEIASDPQFLPREITQAEFEEAWNRCDAGDAAV